MTSSRSSILRSSLVVLAALVLWMGSADAGRKRVVVLDFEGPKAEKFHADVVKLIKKSHTVLTVDKWNEKADELDASAVTDKNIKKIAKKLKIDGVITGKIEKRRDEYIVRLKLRSGTTGELVGSQVQTKSESARLDAQSQRDIKDELIATIEELDSNRGGADEEEEEEEVAEDEEEEAPKKSGFGKKGQMSTEEDPKALAKKKKAEEEEAKRLAKEEEKRKKAEDEQRKKDEEKKKKDDAVAEKKKKDDAKKKKADDEAAALATKKDRDDDEEAEEPKQDEDEEEEEDRPKKKRTAARDDDEDEESIEEEADEDSGGSGRDLSPAGRAVDAVVGMSFTARQLKFAYAGDLGKPPPGYKQKIPVAGGILDVTFYPLAFGKTKGILRGIGLTLLYDQVLVINSQKKYSDDQGVQRVADLNTKENRWAVGPVLRYPMGKLVVGGSLTYGRQQFTVAQQLPNNEPTVIPNVHYTMITPAAFLRFPATSKIVLNADLAFHGITDTGQIQKTGMEGYGAATVTGYEAEGGVDYMVTKNIFARASVRYEAISIKFKGDPTSMSNLRDMDPEQDVTAAKDTYFGGTVTAGYVF
jgi:hypothetical protein